MMQRFLRRFAHDERGVSAIEFALTAPVLVISLLGVVDIGNVVYRRHDMESALRSGAQYFMNGGEDLTKATQVVDESWTTKPNGVTVTAETFCMCAGVVHACTSVCDDGSYPASYHRINASATFPGILMDDSYDTSQSVRVR
jgi:Flp pilus assembly protein TadG